MQSLVELSDPKKAPTYCLSVQRGSNEHNENTHEC